jgi:hypothetical protein
MPKASTQRQSSHHGDELEHQQSGLYSPQTDVLKAGDTVVLVQDTQLAAAMIAVGIPLRQDPPYTHIERADGRDIWTYCFYPTDQEGEISAADCIAAWKRDLEFMKEFPLHPFSFAMAAVKNMTRLHHQQTEVDPNPQIAFRVPSDKGIATLLVVKNSKKHQAALRRGYKQL